MIGFRVLFRLYQCSCLSFLNGNFEVGVLCHLITVCYYLSSVKRLSLIGFIR